MYSCHQCSYVLDDSSAPLPSRCPRCGATVERKLRPAGDSATGGAPRIPTLPPFPRLELKSKSAQQPRAQTIFGLEAILPPQGEAPTRAKTPSPVPSVDDPPDEELTDYEGFTPLDDADDSPPLELGFTPAGSGTTSDSALITGIPDFAGRNQGSSADRSDDYLTLDALGPGLGENSNAGPGPQRPIRDIGSAELPGLPARPAEESYAELPVIPQPISLDESALLPGLTSPRNPSASDAELPGLPDALALDESAPLPGLRGPDPSQSDAELPALSDPLEIGESAPLPGLRNDALPDLTDALTGDDDDLDLNLPAPGGNLPAPGGNLPTPGDSFLPAPGGILPRPGGQLPTPGVSLPRSASSLPMPGSSLPQSAASLPTPGGNLPRSGSELPRSGTELPRSSTGTLHGRGPRTGAPPPPPRAPGRPPPPPGANRNAAASGAALADELPSLDELGDLDGDHLPPLSESGLEDSLPSLDDLGPEPANSGPSVPLRSAGKSARANPPPMGASTQIDSILIFA